MAVSTTPIAGARRRVERWILRSVALLRLAQYGAPLPVVVAHTIGDWPPGQAWLVAGSYSAGAAWSVWMFLHSLRHNGHRIRPALALVDLLLITALQTAMPLTLGADRMAWQNWTYGPAIGAAFVVILYGPHRWRWPLACLPVVSWATIPVVGAVTATPVDHSDVIAWSIGMLLFAGLGAHVAAVLRALAVKVDEARAAEAAAVEREAALRASLAERRKHWRGLHDTALTTLEMIAGGTWDIDSVQVRHRCQQDAAYLRSLMMGDDTTASTGLVTLLSEVLRDRSALGLRVHPQFDDLPTHIPALVADAITGAAREALNNVAKYAEVAEAWLTAVGTAEGGVQVTIVDRGIGFDLATATPRGMTRSIRHTMEEVGGTATVDSAPGEGTTVELTWAP
ncbi:hypothetical protein [Lentzea sp. NBRC 102530]|uniref:sensor histidine kinase n=1 Tax=Lentzea sp. NBRC 102530 TaxID=3032201 RepID=UPI0024A1F20B|nr:hypothetical protein [Lentzea sp. NBRC 102530]GLY50848.1 hypothetical protein Lesp01_45040 [Lentzea sp. NBRC 102530]